MCASKLTEAFDILFKFKVGDVVCYRTDPEHAPVIVATREAIQSKFGLEQQYELRWGQAEVSYAYEFELVSHAECRNSPSE